jgi:hypothetical protein
MKQPLRYLAVLTAICLLLTSCKPDAPVFPDGVTLGKSSSDSYQPNTKGSFWTYISDFPSTYTIKQVMTGTTKSINGNTYYQYNETSSVAGTAEGNFSHVNNIYKLRGNTVVAGITVEFLYLDDAIAIGKTWTVPVTDNGMLNGIPAQIIGKVVEKGITKTVLNKTYTNVIHTNLELQYDMSGFSTVAVYDLYIAKGVGIIETDTDLLGLQVTSKLSEYSIK